MKEQTQREQWNEKRRLRYSTDRKYRNTVRDRRKQAYRAKDATKVRDCRTNAVLVARDEAGTPLSGSMREVVVNGTPKRMHCYTTQELAPLLEYSSVNLFNWQGAGRFPKPPYQTRGSRACVYLPGQVRRFLDIIGKHQETCQYLKTEHEAVIARLHAAVK